MKNTLFLLPILLLLSNIVSAQVGVHVQERSGNRVWVHNKDSVFMSIGSKDFSRVCLINPATKEWKYLNSNSADYHEYTGFFVMKNNREGVMSYPYNPNKVYKTNDGWKTVSVVADAPTLNQLVITKAGYVGFNSAIRTIYFSPDGLTWKSVASGGTSDISLLRSFKNKVILYTGATNSFVSTDGGQNFSFVDINMSFPGFGKGKLSCFEMISEDTLIVVYEKLYKTFNGGATAWTSYSAPQAINKAIVKNKNEIYLGDQLGKSYFTSDGGATWQPKTGIAATNGFYIGNVLYDLPNSVSYDNGNTWHDFLPAFSSASFNDINFSGNKGLVGKKNGRVNLSLDKGRSFSGDIVLPTSQHINAVKVLDNGDLMVLDGSGKIFYSTDNGIKWTQNATGVAGYKFGTSSNNNTILIGGFTQYPSISHDHGKTFKSIFVKGGAHTQSISPSGNVYDVIAWFELSTAKDVGWIISKWTTNNVQTVQDSFRTANESLVDLHNATDNVGYLITFEKTTKQNRICKTTSGWSLGDTKLISTIDPVKSGVVNYEHNPFTARTMRIQTFGADTVVLTSTGNRFYHISFNGGLTWKRDSLADVHASYPSMYPSIKNSYFFNSDEKIVLLNQQGIYVDVKSSGGGTTDIGDIAGTKNNMPTGYELMQNYPNPFNPETTISYRLQAASHVSIKVYDVLGREVVTLVDEYKQPGSYVKTLHATSLPSGIYFYRLQAGSFVSTKKMILVK
jgi:photosystem II stability/assembly factor-like uncharacterized protein